MTYSPNANWNSRTGSPAMSPTYFLDIDALSALRFSTCALRNPTSGRANRRILKVPQSLGQKLSQVQGRASIGSVMVDLLDHDGSLTAQIMEQPGALLQLAQLAGTSTPCGVTAGSSGRGLSADPTKFTEVVAPGATPGATEFTFNMAASETDKVVGCMQTAAGKPGIELWPAGTWTFRCKIFSANTNLRLREVHVCRANASCTSFVHVGTGSPAGGFRIWQAFNDVVSVTVTGVQTIGAKSDTVLIVLVFSNTAGSQQGGSFLGDQQIDTPLNYNVYGLLNEDATLYSGYADLDEADYAPVARLQVQQAQRLGDGKTWRLSLGDLKRNALDDVFVNADATQDAPYDTDLVADAAVGATVIKALDAQGAQENDLVIAGPSTHGSYPGAEEVLRILRAPEPIAGGVGFSIFIKGALTKAYKSGDPVRWAAALVEGNPVNIIYSVLTGDFANGTFPLTKVQGVPTGLGVDPLLIDTVGFQDERDYFFPTERWRFIVTKKQPGFRFLEGKLYRWMGYPRVRGDGKLGFRSYSPPKAADCAAGLPQIAEADVMELRHLRGDEVHTNRVRVGIDSGEGGASRVIEFVIEEDAEDQAKTETIASIEEDDTGFKTDMHGQRIASARLNAMLRRFGGPPMQYRVTCPMTKRAVEVGDWVELTHREAIHPRTGAIGVTKLRVEVVEKTEGFEAERVEFLLQDAGYERPAWIATDAQQASYASASAAEKEYAYIAPDSGDFADSGKPYEII